MDMSPAALDLSLASCFSLSPGLADACRCKLSLVWHTLKFVVPLPGSHKARFRSLKMLYNYKL